MTLISHRVFQFQGTWLPLFFCKIPAFVYRTASHLMSDAHQEFAPHPRKIHVLLDLHGNINYKFVGVETIQKKILDSRN